jgi:hypothetical protein
MRRLTLLTTAILAILAMTATTALASDPLFPGDPYDSVEVLNEASGNVCDDVTVDGPNVSGGCLVEDMHADEVHFGGVTCDVTLGQINVAGDGSFSASDIAIRSPNPSFPTCFVTACRDANNDPLPWNGTYFTHGNLELAYIPVCVNDTLTDAMTVVVDHTPGVDETWEFSASFNWLSTGDWHSDAVETEIDWHPGA